MGKWKRYYPVTFIDDQDDVVALDEIYSELQARFGMSQASLNRMIFRAGVDVMVDEVATPEIEASWAIERKLKNLREKWSKVRRIHKIYKLMERDRDALEEWGKESNIDETFIKKAIDGKYDPDPPWHDTATEWLSNLLESGEMSTADIKSAAIESEIIDSSAKDWEKLRKVASRNGWIGGKIGYWSK
jgi:hypothetical protein